MWSPNHQFCGVHLASLLVSHGSKTATRSSVNTSLPFISSRRDSWNAAQPQCSAVKSLVNIFSLLCGHVCAISSFLHSFIHSFSITCWCNSQWSPSMPVYFLAIYSRSFKRPNQKLWTSSRETGPKHPEEPFCLTFIHSCSFSRVPPESIWQTLVEKKRLWGKKNNKSFLRHPHPICCGIIFFYYLQIMCADMISTVWSGGHCGCCSCCFLFVELCDMRQRGGKNPPPCASNPFRTLLMACQFPLPFHFLSN